MADIVLDKWNNFEFISVFAGSDDGLGYLILKNINPAFKKWLDNLEHCRYRSNAGNCVGGIYVNSGGGNMSFSMDRIDIGDLKLGIAGCGCMYPEHMVEIVLAIKDAVEQFKNEMKIPIVIL